MLTHFVGIELVLNFCLSLLQLLLILICCDSSITICFPQIEPLVSFDFAGMLVDRDCARFHRLDGLGQDLRQLPVTNAYRSTSRARELQVEAGLIVRFLTHRAPEAAPLSTCGRWMSAGRRRSKRGSRTVGVLPALALNPTRKGLRPNGANATASAPSSSIASTSARFATSTAVGLALRGSPVPPEPPPKDP
jgi:hypothetical protein